MAKASIVDTDFQRTLNREVVPKDNRKNGRSIHKAKNENRSLRYSTKWS